MKSHDLKFEDDFGGGIFLIFLKRERRLIKIRKRGCREKERGLLVMEKVLTNHNYWLRKIESKTPKIEIILKSIFDQTKLISKNLLQHKCANQ